MQNMRIKLSKERKKYVWRNRDHFDFFFIFIEHKNLIQLNNLIQIKQTPYSTAAHNRMRINYVQIEKLKIFQLWCGCGRTMNVIEFLDGVAGAVACCGCGRCGSDCSERSKESISTVFCVLRLRADYELVFTIAISRFDFWYLIKI